MKNKLIIGLVGLALVAVGVNGFISKEIKRNYLPREASNKQLQSWENAAKYYNIVKGNVNTGKIEVSDIMNSQKEVAQRYNSGARSALGLTWAEAGPDNVGGRTRAMVIDKDDSNHLIAGAVQGGLFESTDGGARWTRLQSFDDVTDVLNFSPAISTMVQDTEGNIYVGTGCTFETSNGQGGSGMIGRGLFKSTDKGKTWTKLTSASPDAGNNSDSKVDLQDTSKNNVWVYTNRLAVDVQTNDVYAAGDYGLARTRDGGVSWEYIFYDLNGDWMSDACKQQHSGVLGKEVKITTDGVVMCVLGTRIYRTTTDLLENVSNHCENFTEITGVTGARISIAISPVNENYMYAISVDNSGELVGIYKSINKGESFTLLQGPIAGYFGPNSGLFNGQGIYDLAIGASNQNENEIIIGGVQLWKHNGNLTRIAAEFKGSAAAEYIVHSDKHEVVYDPNIPGTVYILHDGGISKSIDGGKTFAELNRGYNTFQAYGMAFDNDGTMMGGAQDNGTVEMNMEVPSRPLRSVDILGGDGYDCEFSQITDLKFASIYTEQINRGVDGGAMGQICNRTGSGNAGPTCETGNFYTRMRLWESLNDTTSQATVQFTNTNLPVGIQKGDDAKRNFKGQFEAIQDGAVFVEGGMTFFAGTPAVPSTYQFLSDSAGKLYDTKGQEKGTFNYNTGEYDFTFDNPPTSTQTIWGTFKTMFPAGTTLHLISNSGTATAQLPIDYVLPVNLNPDETITVQDPVQSLLAVNAGSGVAITRDALNIADLPIWITLPGLGGTAFALEFTPDGDKLFVGTETGGIYRVTGLKDVYSKDDVTSNNTDLIFSGVGRALTGLAIDPNNPNNVVATVGGYGTSTDHVYLSTNALSANPTFTNVTGDLPNMPVYDAIIDIADGNRVVIGTEYGVWATEDIYAGSVTWTDESGALGHVPVFDVRQQTHDYKISPNKGQIYLGTHARGMWKSSTSTVGLKEFEETTNKTTALNSLSVFPNPMDVQGTIAFNLAKGMNATIEVYSINGSRVEALATNQGFTKGDNMLTLDVANYENGTYFVVFTSEEERKVSKFIVM